METRTAGLRNTGQEILDAFTAKTHIAPLAIFRIAFGAIMFISTVRFILKGWIVEYYVKPLFHFTFYGLHWVKPMGAAGMYTIYILMAIGSLGIMLGLFYRWSSFIFFITFLYAELLDKTYYLNHYYLVSLIAFLLLFVPANRYFALDVNRKPSTAITHVPGWMISIFKLQLLIVYFYAGIAKINYEWLIEALPLRIWLPANEHLYILGPLLKQKWVAYLLSWSGALYDLSIGFLLLQKRTRSAAYFAVVVFHLFTALLFKIGMFPYIMMAVTIIFFSTETHQLIIKKLRRFFSRPPLQETPVPLVGNNHFKGVRNVVFACYFLLQLLLPFRYLMYPGNLLWTEEGYRFSWRVMLMEKSGIAFFSIEDPSTGRTQEVINSNYLTSFQEKMMATQPDMILQYAHFLDDEFVKSGIKDPIVRAQCYVTLNGRRSQLFIDSTVDLSSKAEEFSTKDWILASSR